SASQSSRSSASRAWVETVEKARSVSTASGEPWNDARRAHYSPRRRPSPMGSFSPPLTLTVARPAPRLLVLAYHAITSAWSHELADLAEQGWEIGSHSRTHPLLSALTDAEIETELGGSREEIVGRIGRCASISYPWGELDERVIGIAGRVGYRVGSGLVGGRVG